MAIRDLCSLSINLSGLNNDIQLMNDDYSLLYWWFQILGTSILSFYFLIAKHFSYNVVNYPD